MPRAWVFGGGGHARVVASMLDRTATFVVPHATAPDQVSEGDFFARLDEHRADPVYLGLGNADVRRRTYERLLAHGVRAARAIAPNAFIARDAEIGDGVVICPGAVVNSRARIGVCVIVNTLSGIDHDCILGDHTQVSPGVSLAGTVHVGSHGFFGIKAAVFPNVTIGNNVVVMAGALVTTAVPDRVQVGGSPARIVKTL